MGSLIGQDLALHDQLNCELIGLAGTKEIKYYALLHSEVPKDPLYNEPLEEFHQKDKLRDYVGICVDGFFGYPESTYRTGEEGQVVEYDATLQIARKMFENKFKEADFGTAQNIKRFREPKIGDVVNVQGRYYDILGISPRGQLNDTIDQHLYWELKLKNRTNFDAGRRIEAQ